MKKELLFVGAVLFMPCVGIASENEDQRLKNGQDIQAFLYHAGEKVKPPIEFLYDKTCMLAIFALDKTRAVVSDTYQELKNPKQLAWSMFELLKHPDMKDLIDSLENFH